MSETLQVTTHRENHVGILTTKGYINNIGAEKIAEASDALLSDGAKHILLNLEQSRIINSIGISILIEVIEKVKETGGKVGFCNVTPTIAKTFQIMGLLKASTVYQTQDEALSALAL